jgi:hypothetical protein
MPDARAEPLNLSDIRSVSHPFGGGEDLNSINPARRKLVTRGAVKHYVSQPSAGNHDRTN